MSYISQSKKHYHVRVGNCVVLWKADKTEFRDSRSDARRPAWPCGNTNLIELVCWLRQTVRSAREHGFVSFKSFDSQLTINHFWRNYRHQHTSAQSTNKNYFVASFGHLCLQYCLLWINDLLSNSHCSTAIYKQSIETRERLQHPEKCMSKPVYTLCDSLQ